MHVSQQADDPQACHVLKIVERNGQRRIGMAIEDGPVEIRTGPGPKLAQGDARELRNLHLAEMGQNRCAIVPVHAEDDSVFQG